MDINPKIFKAYDIRGIYPSEINEQVIVPIVKATYAFLAQDLRHPLSIVVGRDMRLSSPSLYAKIIEALVDCGASVIDAGLVATPTFYFAVSNGGYDGGIQLTASHNPKEYNGIKIVKKDQKGLIKIGKSTGMDQIKDLALKGEFTPPSEQGTVTKKTGFVEEEVEKALDVVGHPTVKKFKVVADTANAMGALYISALADKIAMELIKMNYDLDGSFPAHQADPLQFDTLKDLQAKVLEEKADFGLAPDGDGDRLFFIDEKGSIVEPTTITALVAREFLKKKGGETILFDIRYILTPQEIVKEHGGTSVITKVGHAFITEKLYETDGVFAGESSAHYYYRWNGYTEEQITTILCVMKVLTEEGKTLSKVGKELRRSVESGEINFKVENASAIMTALKETFKDGQLSTLDGIAIDYPQWRFNVRTSNTEPLLRLNVEAREQKVMEEKRDAIVKVIESFK